MIATGARYLRGADVPVDSLTLTDENLYETLATTYVAVGNMLRRDPTQWAAWKLGGTNHASRKAFGVSELYYGALTHREILSEPAQAPGLPLTELKGEVEVALRIADDGQGYDAWCVALEMPSSPISNLAECGVRALVADRCAAGALLLGPISRAPMPSLDHAVFGLEQNGETLDAAGLDALTASPAHQLTDFLVMARDHGLSPRPGDWVATGGITKCCDFRDGARVRVLLDGVVQIDTEITRAVSA